MVATVAIGGFLANPSVANTPWKGSWDDVEAAAVPVTSFYNRLFLAPESQSHLKVMTDREYFIKTFISLDKIDPIFCTKKL